MVIHTLERLTFDTQTFLNEYLGNHKTRNVFLVVDFRKSHLDLSEIYFQGVGLSFILLLESLAMTLSVGITSLSHLVTYAE